MPDGPTPRARGSARSGRRSSEPRPPACRRCASRVAVGDLTDLGRFEPTDRRRSNGRNRRIFLLANVSTNVCLLNASGRSGLAARTGLLAPEPSSGERNKILVLWEADIAVLHRPLAPVSPKQRILCWSGPISTSWLNRLLQKQASRRSASRANDRREQAG
jgi:hypothetical protein